MQRLQSLSVRFLISNLFKPQRVKVNSTAQSLQKIFTSDVWFLITVDLILTSDAHWWNKTFCPDMIAQVFSCSKGGRVSVEFKNFNETWTLRLEPGSQLLLLTSCWTKSLKKKLTHVWELLHFQCDQTSNLETSWEGLSSAGSSRRAVVSLRHQIQIQIFSGALHPDVEKKNQQHCFNLTRRDG